MKKRCRSIKLATAILIAFTAAAAFAEDKDDPGVPLLTVNEAISLALENNRVVKNSGLEEEKYEFQLSTIRSKRLPQFRVDILGGELLHSIDFTFPAGSFGNYPGIGPIPSTDAKINSPAVFTTYVTAGIDQPILQLYKIGLGVRATELARDIAREDVRAEQQKITAEVQEAYFNLVATYSAVDAAQEAVKTLEEAQRITARYAVEETVLRADVLEVEASLVNARHDLLTAENGLATRREHLNQLLGRDLATQFRVEPAPEDHTSDLTLETARQKAQVNRPENRQARLKEKQADYDRRIAKAEYIPDLSISLRYLGMSNVEVLPDNVTSAGFYFYWEPFDWGRRKNKIQEKIKTLEQAHNGIHETESQISVEVGTKYRAWQESSLLLKATRATSEAAAEQLRVISNRYKEEAALIKDLLHAQAQSSEKNYQYQQALSSYWNALADLRKAIGD